MRIVCTSYINTSQFNSPLAWLKRIDFFTGVLEELAKYHEVHSIEQINFSGQLNRNNVTYHFVNYGKKTDYYPHRLHSYIQALKPDLVWVHGFIFPIQLIQLRWRFGSRLKIVVQNHAEKPFKGWKKVLQKITASYVNAFFFTANELGQEWMDKGVIRDRSKIHAVMEASSVFHPIDKTTAKSETGVHGNPVFLWVGRLDGNKDPVTVVQAFLDFNKKYPRSKLYMIHQTDELLNQVMSLLSDAENKNSVSLVGKKEHDELQAWYNSADFIISGSHYEGSGIAVCEGMSCGCIPIVTNIASFRKMTANGKYGLLYEPGNTEQLETVLHHAVRLDIDEERIKVLEQFKRELSFEAIARKIDYILKSI
jgi:glycosyltransferase involved in cell wall biosynthesis